MAHLWSDEATAEIAAPPESVWALLSNIELMGDWSPVCRRCEWLGGASSAAVGARFVGHNRQLGARWSRECVITTCNPARALEFHTLFDGRPSTLWRYHLEPSPLGTRITESYEMLAVPRWVALLQRIPRMSGRSRRDAQRGMQQTLQRLKATTERTP